MSTYTTVQGDYWDTIAKSQLGSEVYMDDLIKANTKHITEGIFSAGVTLTIPEIETPKPTILPPWKR